MQAKAINNNLSVTGQIAATEMTEIAKAGFKSIICNRPDGEGSDQPTFAEIAEAAKKAGLEARYIPVVSGKVTDADAAVFGAAMAELPGPVLAYCRSGARSTMMWEMSQRLGTANQKSKDGPVVTSADIVIVGAGAAGIAAASSLLARKSDLDIVIIDPAETHYYQPGWTMVGGGIFDAPSTARPTASLIPRGVRWVKAPLRRLNQRTTPSFSKAAQR